MGKGLRFRGQILSRGREMVKLVVGHGTGDRGKGEETEFDRSFEGLLPQDSVNGVRRVLGSKSAFDPNFLFKMIVTGRVLLKASPSLLVSKLSRMNDLVTGGLA